MKTLKTFAQTVHRLWERTDLPPAYRGLGWHAPGALEGWFSDV